MPDELLEFSCDFYILFRVGTEPIQYPYKSTDTDIIHLSDQMEVIGWLTIFHCTLWNFLITFDFILEIDSLVVDKALPTLDLITFQRIKRGLLWQFAIILLFVSKVYLTYGSNSIVLECNEM